eukprot:363181-Chlamydomonas_euryale.AAC.5
MLPHAPASCVYLLGGAELSSLTGNSFVILCSLEPLVCSPALLCQPRPSSGSGRPTATHSLAPPCLLPCSAPPAPPILRFRAPDCHTLRLEFLKQPVAVQQNCRAGGRAAAGGGAARCAVGQRAGAWRGRAEHADGGDAAGAHAAGAELWRCGFEGAWGGCARCRCGGVDLCGRLHYVERDAAGMHAAHVRPSLIPSFPRHASIPLSCKPFCRLAQTFSAVAHSSPTQVERITSSTTS